MKREVHITIDISELEDISLEINSKSQTTEDKLRKSSIDIKWQNLKGCDQRDQMKRCAFVEFHNEANLPD